MALLAAAVTNHKCHNHQPFLSIIPPNPRPRGGGFVSVGGGKAQRFYSVREFERIVSKNQPKIDYILTSNDDDMGDLPF